MSEIILYCSNISADAYKDASTEENYTIFTVTLTAEPYSPAVGKLKIIIERGESIPYEIGKSYTFILKGEEK